MYHCEKCGATIKDINKPCPSCGMYLNQDNVVNNDKKSIANIIIFVGVILALISASIIANFNFNNKIVRYETNNYVVTYANKKWGRYKDESDDSFVLRYHGGRDAYLIFDEELVDLQVDMDNVDERNDLYLKYLDALTNDEEITYTNIMSEIKKMNNTNYYYLTTDFRSDIDSSYYGKSYFIYKNSGECLRIMLVLSSDDAKVIEDDVLNVIQKIEM